MPLLVKIIIRDKPGRFKLGIWNAYVQKVGMPIEFSRHLALTWPSNHSSVAVGNFTQTHARPCLTRTDGRKVSWPAF